MPAFTSAAENFGEGLGRCNKARKRHGRFKDHGRKGKYSPAERRPRNRPSGGWEGAGVCLPSPIPVRPWLSPAMASPPPFGAGSARGQANSRSVGGTSRRGEGGGVQAPEAGGCRCAENFPRLQVGLDDRALSSVRSKSKPPPPSTK